MPRAGKKDKQKDLISDIDASFGEKIRKRQWCVHKDKTINIPAVHAGDNAYSIKIVRCISYASTAGAATLLFNQNVLVGRVHYRTCSSELCFPKQALVVDIKKWKNGEVCGRFFLCVLVIIE